MKNYLHVQLKKKKKQYCTCTCYTQMNLESNMQSFPKLKTDAYTTVSSEYAVQVLNPCMKTVKK